MHVGIHEVATGSSSLYGPFETSTVTQVPVPNVPRKPKPQII